MKSLILGLIVAIAIPEVYADSVVVNSSSAVTFLPNGTSTSTDFSSPFIPANFSSAQTGANAAVLTTIPFYMTAASLTGAGAQWIGTSAGGGNGSTSDFTALYAISFFIPDAFVSGSLSLNFEVDNELGDLNPGVYLNGTALPGSTNNTGCSPVCFLALQNYTDSSATADLVQGMNWLYIDGVNLGQEGGLIFSATISTVNSTGVTPEPSSYGLMLIGLGLLVLRRKRLVAAFR